MPTLSPIVTIWSNIAISSAVLPLLPEKASTSTPLMCSLQRKELPSSMNEITNGTVLGCSGTPFLSVLLVLPHKVRLHLLISSNQANPPTGWDQTGSNGANLSYPQEFGISGTGRDEWIVGAINSIIFLTAGCIGAFIVDPLNHYLGRRGEIFLTACCLTATPIASGFTQSWQALFAVRFVMGIGIGAKNATVPIFSAELAPARVRGALVMFWQLWVVAGGYLFNQIGQLTHMLMINRYLPWFRCQRYRQGYRQDCLASSTRLCFHSRLHPHARYLVHP